MTGTECSYCGALEGHRRESDRAYCERQAALFAEHPEWVAA